MHGPRLRPTFRLETPCGREDMRRRLERWLSDPGCPFESRNAGDHYMVCFPRAARRFWSPWLHVEIEPAADGQSDARVFARFSPAPDVWTAYMLGYLGLATLAIGAGFFAAGQAMLERAPTALWVVVACALIAGVMFWAAQAGQRFAADQMRELRAALERAADVETDGEAEAPR